MDKILLERINQKIAETLSKKDEIYKIVHSLDKLGTNDNSFTYGIVIGRLYNSFYYQSRRLLKRDPTSEELTEFLNILKEHESDFLKF
jgi:hypothetical protein